MNDTAQVCVARHGETDWNLAGILQGWMDVYLNDLGQEQARELASAMVSHCFSRVYSSPLSRALETAVIISRVLKLGPPTCLEGLKERHFGIIQGVPKDELAELNPVFLQQILKRNPACVFEEGESMDDFAARVIDAVMSIGAMHPGERVLVITHGWVMDVITRYINGLPRSAILGIKRKNGECLWLDVTENSIRTLSQDINSAVIP
jgi:probable phosphoglycerate mutase